MGGYDRPRDKRHISLLVRNLKYETSPDKLRSLFSKFGEIRDVYLPLDYYTKKPRGFGFVEYFSPEDADEAMREMDGYDVDGNKIEVFAAKRGRSDPHQMRYRDQRGDPRRRRSRARSYSRGRYRRSSSRDRRRRRSRSRDRYKSRERYRSRSTERRRSGNQTDEERGSRRRGRSPSRDGTAKSMDGEDRRHISRSVSDSR